MANKKANAMIIYMYIKILNMQLYRFYAFSPQEETRASLHPRKWRETPALCVQHHATFKTVRKLNLSSYTNSRMN